MVWREGAGRARYRGCDEIAGGEVGCGIAGGWGCGRVPSLAACNEEGARDRELVGGEGGEAWAPGYCWGGGGGEKVGETVPEQQQIQALEFNVGDIDILDDPWMMDLLGGGYDINMEPQMW